MRNYLITTICLFGLIKAQPNAFQFISTNTGGIIQGTPLINGSSASSDDWIAAFDLEGNCAGAAQLVYIPAYGNVFFGVGLSNFVIFGDDPTTTDIDEGINAGEGFILKLWDSSLDLIIDQTDENGNIIVHEGWQSSNFTPINGFDDPFIEFNFVVNNSDPIILGCLVTEFYEDTEYTFNLIDFEFLDEDGISDDYLEVIVLTGNNYTYSSNTVAPDTNFSGEINVNFQLNDGFSSSEIFVAAINILPVNDPPDIISQALEINVNEDEAIILESSNFNIYDVDGDDSFSILIDEGDHYFFSNDTLFPYPNYFGVLSVNIQPNDGQENGLGSNFESLVTVLPINDSPEVLNLAIYPSIPNQDDTLFVSFEVFDIESGTDLSTTIQWHKNNIYQESFDNMSFILPSETTCEEIWSASVQVFDGESSSEMIESNYVTICGNNTPPVWFDDNAISFSILEDSDSNLFDLSSFIVDQEQASSQISFFAESQDADSPIEANFINETFELMVGTLIENYYTTLDSSISLLVWANDGLGGADTALIYFIIEPVNDAPQINSVPEISIPEDSFYTLFIDSIDYIDVDMDECSLIINPGDSYSVIGDTIFPQTNYFGLLYIPIEISDGSLVDIDTIEISVEAQNDPPTEFSLISPENGETVLINSVNQYTYNLSFNWDLSLDVDDTLKYVVFLENDEINLILDSLAQNNYQISYDNLVTVFESNMVNIFEGVWGVYATDGINRTYCIENFEIVIDAREILKNDQELNPKKFVVFPAFPNPFNMDIKFKIFVNNKQSLSMNIFNLKGELVKSLINNKVLDHGMHIMSWDGKNDDGKNCVSSIYFLNVNQKSKTYKQKLLLLK